MRQLVIAGWAVGGVLALLAEAISRLGARALAVVAAGLDAPHRLAFVVVVAAFAYGEGYLAMQRRFAPSVVARALDAGARSRGCFAVLGAPLHALTLVHAQRRELARAWLGVGLILTAMCVVRMLPDAWRGIVDAGVAAALSWGAVATSARFVHAAWMLRHSEPAHRHNVIRGKGVSP
jgi:hypothetical protein